MTCTQKSSHLVNSGLLVCYVSLPLAHYPDTTIPLPLFSPVDSACKLAKQSFFFIPLNLLATLFDQLGGKALIRHSVTGVCWRLLFVIDPGSDLFNLRVMVMALGDETITTPSSSSSPLRQAEGRGKWVGCGRGLGRTSRRGAQSDTPSLSACCAVSPRRQFKYKLESAKAWRNTLTATQH